MAAWSRPDVHARARGRGLPPSRAQQAIARGTGFTLLEVLVALVIIGVALAGAMRGAMALTNTATDTRQKLIALITADNQLAELRLARGGKLPVGSTTSDCSQGGVTLACEQVVKETPNPFFRRVEMRVSTPRPDGQRRQLAELLTILPVNP